jgi:ATP-dependent Clp protease adaptor protein ClpS
LAQKIHIKPLRRDENESENSEAHFLVLYNDDFNTFEFVIKSLIEVCDHSAEQAEQCATITHFKGKCELKKGLKNELEPMQVALIGRNLKVFIE